MDTRVVKHGNFNHILGKMMSHLISLSNLHESLEEAVGRYKVNVEVKLSEHTQFHVDDLFFVIGIITHMNIVFNKGWPYLLILASDEHSGHSNQLEVLLGHHDLFQVPVNHVYGQEQALGLQLELEVHFNDPVDQDASHSLCDLRLVFHVLVLRLVHHFSSHEVFHNISGEFSYVLWILCVILIAFIDGLMQMHLASALEFFIYALQFLVKLFSVILLFYFF